MKYGVRNSLYMIMPTAWVITLASLYYSTGIGLPLVVGAVLLTGVYIYGVEFMRGVALGPRNEDEDENEGENG